ncbi:Glutathione S-transferase GST-6.0 [Alphaproteobacteria bacterium SO-S41]|nr:Glutathione S-transferase GST-6.0 [Alphaproteobacteria bacterium SO-S41]
MKFYNSIGPNPQAVRVFAAEKGIKLDTVEVDLLKAANRDAEHLARNPAGQTPSLETDGGQFINEITAICEYLEEKFPNPALIGSTPEERAETRMWVRRLDENVIAPRLTGFRYGEGAKFFAGRIPVFPEAAAPLKALAKDREGWINGMLAGRTWFCGERFTLADIMAGVFLAFGAGVGQPVDPANTALAAIVDRVKARASFAA